MPDSCRQKLAGVASGVALIVPSHVLEFVSQPPTRQRLIPGYLSPTQYESTIVVTAEQIA